MWDLKTFQFGPSAFDYANLNKMPILIITQCWISFAHSLNFKKCVSECRHGEKRYKYSTIILKSMSYSALPHHEQAQMLSDHQVVRGDVIHYSCLLLLGQKKLIRTKQIHVINCWQKPTKPNQHCGRLCTYKHV